MQGQMQFSSTARYLNTTGKYFVMLCLAFILSFPLTATAQQTEEVTISPKDLGTIKLKLTRSLNSGKVRVGDYVQFQPVEDVMYTPKGSATSRKLISKDSPVWGRVVDRGHRFTGLKKGRFGIGKFWTMVHGEKVSFVVMRPDMASDWCEDKIPKKTLKAELKALRRYQEHPGELQAVLVARSKARIESLREEVRLAKRVPCVQGRVYATGFISGLPSALLAVATATTLAGIKDDATEAVIGVTLADKLVTQSGLSNIINGVDAEMEKDEIFDVVLSDQIEVKFPPPAPPAPPATPATPATPAPAATSVERVGRFTAPTPPGFLVTNYFSDPVKYPSTQEQPSVYTGKVIERYTDKPSGSRMTMCEPQNPPAGWVVIDRGVDPSICPREPAEQAKGHNYSVILKTP